MIAIGPLWFVVVVAVLALAGFYAWQQAGNGTLPEGFAGGNGRIEAVEIDVSAKSPLLQFTWGELLFGIRSHWT